MKHVPPPCRNLSNLRIAGFLPTKLRLADKLISLNLAGNRCGAVHTSLEQCLHVIQLIASGALLHPTGEAVAAITHQCAHPCNFPLHFLPYKREIVGLLLLCTLWRRQPSGLGLSACTTTSSGGCSPASGVH